MGLWKIFPLAKFFYIYHPGKNKKKEDFILTIVSRVYILLALL